MSELLHFASEGPEEDPTAGEPAYDEPNDMRPDLSEIGLIEIERGVVEDTYENRAALRRAKLNWQPVYDQSGAPTGLIAARSAESMKERRIQSLAEKRPLLVDVKDMNSDYVTGLDLLVDPDACKLAPPWVVGATRAWQKEQEDGGPPTERRAPKGLPHRCRTIKTDGIRCMLWASGRHKDDGLCRVHLRSQRKPGEDIERARKKIIQAAPYAVDVLEDMMESAVSEPVRLKAATEILDRAGVRGGVEIDMGVEITEARPAHVVVAERLAKLASGAAQLESSIMNGQTEGLNGSTGSGTFKSGEEVEPPRTVASPSDNPDITDEKEIFEAELVEADFDPEEFE